MNSLGLLTEISLDKRGFTGRTSSVRVIYLSPPTPSTTQHLTLRVPPPGLSSSKPTLRSRPLEAYAELNPRYLRSPPSGQRQSRQRHHRLPRRRLELRPR